MPEPDRISPGGLSGRRGQFALAAAFLVAFMVFLLYLPALENAFVNWDDPTYVYENLRIRSLDPGLLKWAFTSAFFGNWHPLTTLSFALDYALWGLDPRGWHLVNILLHAFNTLLVALLATRLAAHGSADSGGTHELNKGAIAAGIVTALLFGIHPLHVESVVWVSERKDLLCTFFFLLSLLAYLGYTPSRRPVLYISSLVFFAAALMSKPMAVTLPAVLLILDLHPLGRLKAKGAVLEKIPFFALSLFSSSLTVWAQRSAEAMVALEAYPAATRLFVAVRAYIFYLLKMVLPLDLAPFYPIPEKTGLLSIEFAGLFALLSALTLFCILSFKRRRVFSAVWLYYMVTLLPVIGLVQVGNQAAADRYTYLPALGPFLLAGLLAGLIIERCSKRWLVAPVAGMMLVSGVLADTTIRQIAVWKSSVTLWSYEIELFPDAAHPGHYNRGLAYYGAGEYEAAIEDFKRAVELEPGHARAYNSRGAAYASLGNPEQAVEDFKRAIELNPGHARAYYNLGKVYFGLGDRERGLINYKKAAALGVKEAVDYLRRADVD